MKKLFPITILMLSLCAIGSVTLLSVSSSRTKWMNAEAESWLANKWPEHCKTYGAMSNNVGFGYSVDTNWTFAILSDGTKVELGFRDDGVVVWRPRR